ncbi:MAG: hypothetical protein ACD_3C00130G0015 [uncultured bacterium (gcode 4)]|uniref:LamG-like jellyroll fold domain-containing protein n=1 Tax=uncultured bacterium (gcode 4) TaxID=1234023 RepID=K2G136_9BACT|nr:MAG: hypothetical protein ACD_3C00130G0015 [uncultured bacterium (gcode 4)]
MNKIKNNNAFTLVELIVVIVILAILATIAFLSFSSQSGSARDSARLSDTTNIKKWLELRQAIGWTIPLPANPKVYTWWATATGVSGVMITEWTVNNSILSTLSAWIKDPSWSEYRYSTISQWWQPLYYQLALELENPTSMREDNFNPFIAMSEIIASADDTTSKIVQLKWNYMLDPSLPSLFILSGSTSSASWWIYNPDVCFVLDWSATNNFSSKDNCVAKKDMSLKDYDNSLVWYWDMETLTADWKLKDLSGNGNSGVFSGNILPVSTWGINWKGLYFSWSSMIYTAQVVKYWSSSTATIEIIADTRAPTVWIFTILAESSANANSNTWSWFITDYYTTTSCDWSKAMLVPLLKPDLAWWRITYCPYDKSEGKPKFVTMIFDSSKPYITIFLNWNKMKTYPNSGNSTKPISEAVNTAIKDYVLHIWKRWSDIGNWTIGLIDDVKVYNRALSDSEIKQHAKSIWF